MTSSSMSVSLKTTMKRMPFLLFIMVLILLVSIISPLVEAIEEEQGVGGGILKTFLDYETTLFEARKDEISRFPSLTVVHETTTTTTTTTTTEGDNEAAATEEQEVIPYCHFAFVMPFSGFRPDRIPLQNGVFQGMAAVMLAIEHLNTGNSTIVSQLADLVSSQQEETETTCPIKFTVEFYDTGLSQTEAVDQIIQIISKGGDNDDGDDDDDGHKNKLPCAFIGAARSAVSIPTSIITGLGGYPQISPISTSTQLEDISQYPLFGRTIPSDAGTAVPAILYLRNVLGVKHLAVLHVNDSYGNAYALGLQLAASEYAPDMVIQSYDFPFDSTPDIIRRTIALLKQTQFRYFFGIIFSTVHYDPIMTEAFQQGIAGTGKHNWIFSDSVSTSVFADGFEVGSPLHLTSKGSSRIGAVGGVPGIPKYDLFLQAMQDLDNPHDIQLIQSKHPKYPKEPDYEPYQIEDDPDFFLKATAGVVPFLYDAAIALGLAACRLVSTTSSNNNNINNDTYAKFDGQQHFDTYKSLTFDGASGNNIYDESTGSRLAESARFTLLNFVEDGEMTVVDDDDGAEKRIMKFKTVETYVFQDGEWTQVHPHIFNDGTTIPSPDLEEVAIDYNYLGTALRATGLSMTTLIVLLSILFSAWTYVQGQLRVVRASQPIFLHLITIGCALMGSSILFLSLDDEVVPTQVCSAFCIAFPWFLCVGWIFVFSALFAKTRRVNKIFHNPNIFKRIKVTVWDVMASVLCLMTIATIVLTLWTILQPPHWQREVTSVDQFGRNVETKGSCNYEDGIAYVVTLGVLLLGILVYAVYEAYVARNVSTEYAESEYIALLLATILLVSFLGIPIMIIAEEEPRARFFVSAAIIFTICMATLLLIFVPKIYATIRSVDREGIEYLYPDVDSGSRLKGRRGSASRPRVSVTGLNLQNYNSAISSIRASSYNDDEKGNGETDDPTASDNDDGDGIMVLHHPKEIVDMKQQITDLKSQNKSLIVQMDRMRSLHTKTQSRLNLVTSLNDEQSASCSNAVASAELHVDDEECAKLVSNEGTNNATTMSSPPKSIDMTGGIKEGT